MVPITKEELQLYLELKEKLDLLVQELAAYILNLSIDPKDWRNFYYIKEWEVYGDSVEAVMEEDYSKDHESAEFPLDYLFSEDVMARIDEEKERKHQRDIERDAEIQKKNKEDTETREKAQYLKLHAKYGQNNA